MDDIGLYFFGFCAILLTYPISLILVISKVVPPIKSDRNNFVSLFHRANQIFAKHIINIFIAWLFATALCFLLFFRKFDSYFASFKYRISRH